MGTFSILDGLVSFNMKSKLEFVLICSFEKRNQMLGQFIFPTALLYCTHFYWYHYMSVGYDIP